MKKVLLVLMLFCLSYCKKDSHDGPKLVAEIIIESDRDYLVADGQDKLKLKIHDQYSISNYQTA